MKVSTVEVTERWNSREDRYEQVIYLLMKYVPEGEDYTLDAYTTYDMAAEAHNGRPRYYIKEVVLYDRKLLDY